MSRGADTSFERRVLVVSHDASRTGAPILLLHLLRWIKANSDLTFNILLRADGELRMEFEDLGNVTALTDGNSLPGPVQRALLKRRLARLAASGGGPIYSNTATNGPVLGALAATGRFVMSHIHELETMIRSRGHFDEVKRVTRTYIACSGAVKDNLIQSHGIDPACIRVIHGCLPVRQMEIDPDAYTSVKQELNIPPEAFIVGGSGTTDWRKAPELFVALAGAVIAFAREYRFISSG